MFPRSAKPNWEQNAKLPYDIVADAQNLAPVRMVKTCLNTVICGNKININWCCSLSMNHITTPSFWFSIFHQNMSKSSKSSDHCLLQREHLHLFCLFLGRHDNWHRKRKSFRAHTDQRIRGWPHLHSGMIKNNKFSSSSTYSAWLSWYRGPSLTMFLILSFDNQL